jgi:hypothetical protein
MNSLVRLRWVTPLVPIAVLVGCATIGGDSGVLDVSWTPPAQNVDGTPASDVLEYRIYYYGTTQQPCPGGSLRKISAKTSGSSQQVQTRLTGLKLDEVYYVAVTAVSSTGKESSCSVVASGRAHKPD